MVVARSNKMSPTKQLKTKWEEEFRTDRIIQYKVS